MSVCKQIFVPRRLNRRLECKHKNTLEFHFSAKFIAYEIAKYYGDRYQIIFGVHRNPRINRKGRATSYVHIHMLMNSVSFVDGKMYADNKGANYAFADHIKRITDDYNWKVVYGTSEADEED